MGQVLPPFTHAMLFVRDSLLSRPTLHREEGGGSENCRNSAWKADCELSCGESGASGGGARLKAERSLDARRERLPARPSVSRDSKRKKERQFTTGRRGVQSVGFPCVSGASRNLQRSSRHINSYDGYRRATSQARESWSEFYYACPCAAAMWCYRSAVSFMYSWVLHVSQYIGFTEQCKRKNSSAPCEFTFCCFRLVPPVVRPEVPDVKRHVDQRLQPRPAGVPAAFVGRYQSFRRNFDATCAKSQAPFTDAISDGISCTRRALPCSARILPFAKHRVD